MHVIVYTAPSTLPTRYVRAIRMNITDQQKILSVDWTIDRWQAMAFVDYQSAVQYLWEHDIKVSANSFYPVVR